MIEIKNNFGLSYAGCVDCLVCLYVCLFVCLFTLFYFILSRLLHLAFSANLGLLCMPHPCMGPLV